ncbi:DUF3833 family protein [Mesorhizobium sp. SB112]|uniref:DUF3833 family protein n=1 Tax=Mesorhizobium sp. SB112 TaxID=3151853 RepID=UPI003265F7A2
MRFSPAVAAGLALTALIVAAPAMARDFVLEKYFAGKSRAVGSFSAINGANNSFDVDLTGKWNGKVLTLREDFIYADGKRDTKTWRFTKLTENTYSGTREDVVGETLVTVKGDTAKFTYLVYLSPEEKKNLVRFHDTMVLKDDGTVLNNAWVTKFGFPVAKTKVEFTRSKK